jgi:hypothetical protein
MWYSLPDTSSFVQDKRLTGCPFDRWWCWELDVEVGSSAKSGAPYFHIVLRAMSQALSWTVMKPETPRFAWTHRPWNPLIGRLVANFCPTSYYFSVDHSSSLNSPRTVDDGFKIWRLILSSLLEIWISAWNQLVMRGDYRVIRRVCVSLCSINRKRCEGKHSPLINISNSGSQAVIIEGVFRLLGRIPALTVLALWAARFWIRYKKRTFSFSFSW